MDIQTALATLAEGHDLSQSDTRAVFKAVMSGETTEAQIGGLLMGLRFLKNVSSPEPPASPAGPGSLQRS